MTTFQKYMTVLVFILKNISSLIAEFECCNDEISLQDIRVIRDDTKENKSTSTFITENPFLGRNAKEDFSWLDDTIKDIAYYLRDYKFNEYDRRYEDNEYEAPKEFYTMYPRPPLRSLHWEVQQFCEPSFLSCMKYVNRKLKGTALKRQDDTNVVIMEQKWDRYNNSKEIEEIDNECVKMREQANRLADPFQGPIERFQWRTTASYYLCWYTMNEVTELKHLNESCDNFASCLDDYYGIHNRDFRAKDTQPYICAMHSFCPDPCCPSSKHYLEPSYCEDKENPCYVNNPEGRRRCEFKRSENLNFHDLIINRWNVTCNCVEKGYVWSSRYGICVDIDECDSTKHGCNNSTEVCVNLPGSHLCACRWGYSWNFDENKCTENGALSVISKERKSHDEKNRTFAKSIVRRIYDKLVSLRSNAEKYPTNILYIFLMLYMAISLYCLLMYPIL